MNPGRSIASLSLDLDNEWTYLKTRGIADWQSFPSYLDVVTPRFLEACRETGLKMTVFVVGQDAALEINREALRAIAGAGHEIGNHSFHHEPWLHLYSAGQIEAEIAAAEESIVAATGVHPTGFRGPGYSLSRDVLTTLARRGYAYDCSTFPTFIGPLARLYYFLRSPLSHQERAQRSRLFGTLAEGLRPLKPYHWNLDGTSLLEIPVTTMPGLRAPFHLSYLHYLAGISPALARTWFRSALRLCRLAGIAPSLLLHPLDFLGVEDVPNLGFFPAMDQPAGRKLELARWVLAEFASRHRVVPVGVHARELQRTPLPVRHPAFRAS
jgi:peptidoglycan/xylan/chitin deacetylase (PgdA/CDA1 family)